MFSLVMGALRARRAQTGALFALTVIAALGATFAPWYLHWARDAVERSDIASAPVEQRVVTIDGAVRYAPGQPLPLAEIRELVAARLEVDGVDLVAGARLFGWLGTDQPSVAGASKEQLGLYLNVREAICEQVRVEGSCPERAGEVLMSHRTAARLGVRPGDPVEFEAFRLASPARLTVSGLYEIADVLGPYWTGTGLLAGALSAVNTVVADPVFVSAETLVAAEPDGLDMDVHVVLPPSAYHGQELERRLTEAATALKPYNLTLETEATELLAQIARDQRLVALGSGVATAELLALCWFALFLAVGATADERRPDLALLKLRGTPAWRVWLLNAQPSALPMLAGAVAGWLAGIVAAAILPGGMTGAWGLSASAALLACLGALVAAALAEARALRAPVLTLLRRVPARRRGVRTEVVDLVVVALALAGIYQGYAETTAGAATASTLALLAPGLLGLAVALLVARALPPLAAALGGWAVRVGRAGIALAALHLARRPAAHRVFAVLAVAATLLMTALLHAGAAADDWTRRAMLEIGADRVLIVEASDSAHLLRAVREADPSGEYAMAVARTDGVRAEERVLAVDATRLGNVALLDGAAELAERLRPPANEAVTVADGPITVDGTLDGDLVLNLATVDGAAKSVTVAALDPAAAEVSGCPEGCRLVSLGLAPGAIVELRGIAQPGREVVGPVQFADVSRWRPPLGDDTVGPVLAARDGKLTVTVPTGQGVDGRVFLAAAPAPLPVVVGGERPQARRAGDPRITLLGADRVPFAVVDTVEALPRLSGDGVMVDLEYADRSLSEPGEAATLEVWLAAGAPSSIVDALGARGVRVLAETSVDARAAALGRQGPGLALRFQLGVAALIGVLAGATLAVTLAAQATQRDDELAALRAQGLAPRDSGVARHGGTAALLTAAVVTGLVAAAVAAVTIIARMPAFGDLWTAP